MPQVARFDRLSKLFNEIVMGAESNDKYYDVMIGLCEFRKRIVKL